MPKCTYCSTFVLFGGQRDQTGYYCNRDCQQSGNLLALSDRIPRDQITSLVDEVHQGNCPQCSGSGPVDMHLAHSVWSALIITHWKSAPKLSCKKCGVKRQIGAMFFSGIFGWWGFPWGLIATPLQISKNLAGMFGGPKPGQPTPLLQKFIKIQAAANVVEQSRMQREVSSNRTPPPLPLF